MNSRLAWVLAVPLVFIDPQRVKRPPTPPPPVPAEGHRHSWQHDGLNGDGEMVRHCSTKGCLTQEIGGRIVGASTGARA